MQAIEIQKYLLAVCAACFIGIGSGFLTLAEYMFERDKEAAKYSIDFEAIANIKIDKKTDCDKVENHKMKCEFALYLHKSNEEIMKALEFIANILMYTGLGCLSVVGTIEVLRKKS